MTTLPSGEAPQTSKERNISVFAGTKSVVTGGLGFMGSAVAKRLADEGADVLVIDSLVPEYGGNLANVKGYEDRLTINISDVRDQHSLRYLMRDCQYLFNLAGQTSHLDSMTDPFTDLDINCRAQLSILEVCREVCPTAKVVFASTRQIYGRPEYTPTDEKHLLRPVDVNGINKMAGEWYHILYNNVYGVRCAALRLTNTYGPGMRIKDARQTFLGVWIRQVLSGEPIEVWGGQQLRDFTYVSDAVDAFLLAGQDESADGEVFNVGGSPPISLLELADLLVKVAGGGSVIVKDFPEARKRIDIGDYVANDDKLRSSLGWGTSRTLEEGLKETVAFYREKLQEYL